MPPTDILYAQAARSLYYAVNVYANAQTACRLRDTLAGYERELKAQGWQITDVRGLRDRSVRFANALAESASELAGVA